MAITNQMASSPRETAAADALGAALVALSDVREPQMKERRLLEAQAKCPNCGAIVTVSKQIAIGLRRIRESRWHAELCWFTVRWRIASFESVHAHPFRSLLRCALRPGACPHPGIGLAAG